MNAENLRTLAHELRADPESYDQSTWGYETECGTVACVAGHAAKLAGLPLNRRGSLIAKAAREWLGIDSAAASTLFNSDPRHEHEGCVEGC